MASFVKTQQWSRPYPAAHADRVTIISVVEVPDGTVVNALEFAAGGRLRAAEPYSDTAFCVLSGSGWAEADGVERTEISAGNRLFVRTGEAAELGTEVGMVVIEVGGDWKYPE